MVKTTKYYLLLICLIVLASCYNSKKALQQTTRAAVSYPAEFADLVNKLMPIKSTRSSIETKYLQGKDSVVYRTDTILHCDSAKQTFKVPGCKDTWRVDTFYSKQVDSFENTRLVEALNGELSAAYVIQSKVVEEKAKLSGQLKEAKQLNWKLSVALGISILGLGVMIKLKFF